MSRIDSILFFLFLISISGKAQNQLSVFGSVRDGDGTGLPGATVLLITPNDTLTTISDKIGHFVFHSPYSGHLILKLTMQGYKLYTSSFWVDPSRKSFVLDPIVLTALYEDLVPVVITKENPITVLHDTLEYHAGAYQVRAGAELERLMKLLPGIDWDTAGNIIINGKPVNQIMIDGQNFTVASLKTALQYLPVDIVDKVQVINDYGDKARLTGIKSGESEKVLNIVLKKDKHNGGIANLQVGAGGDDNRLGLLFTDVFSKSKQLSSVIGSAKENNVGKTINNSIYFSYADTWSPKWSANTFFNLLDLAGANNSGLSQTNFFSGGQTQQQFDVFNSSGNHELNIGSTIKFTPTVNTLLRINATIGVGHSTYSTATGIFTIDSINSLVKTISGNVLDSLNSRLVKASTDIYYERTMERSKNKLSAEISYSAVQHPSVTTQSNNTRIQMSGDNDTSRLRYIIHTTYLEQDAEGRLNYFLALTKNAFWQFSYRFNYIQIHNAMFTQTPLEASNNITTIDSLSTNYTLNSIFHTLHSGYMLHLTKVNVDLGVDARQGFQNGKIMNKNNLQRYRYFEWLPDANISFQISTWTKLHFQYKSSITLPTLQQLLPVIDLSNPQTPVQGNPNLVPAYNQAVSLNYEQSSLRPGNHSAFSLGFSYNTTNNMIISSLTHPQDTTITAFKTNFINLNGFHNIQSDYHFNFPATLKGRLRISNSGSIKISNVPNLTDMIFFPTSSLIWEEKLQCSIVIPEKSESTLFAAYQHSISQSSIAGITVSPPFSAVYWGITSLHTFWQKWVLTYKYNQVLTSTSRGRLQANPVILNIELRRDFLSNNQLSLRLTANNIFDQSASVNQSTTATSLIQNRTYLAGRYLLATIVLKLEHFSIKKTNSNP